MKTLLLFFALSFSAGSVFAQEVEQNTAPPQESEQDQLILTEAGDFGLGFDAVPFLEYLGNMFNGTMGNSVGADFPGSSQIFIKYFFNDDVALRSRLRLGQDITTSRNRVMFDNQAFPDTDVQVTDEWVSSSTDIGIGAGLEFRKGKGKVVGVFGAEASFLYGQNKVTYDYGNPITESNQTPSSTFGGVNNGRFEREVEQQFNRQMGAGINGFIGVEYFLASKLSLGAEFTLGFDFMKDFRSQRTYEFWDVVSQSVQTRSTVFEGGNSLSLNTGNYGGSINLMFYF